MRPGQILVVVPAISELGGRPEMTQQKGRAKIDAGAVTFIVQLPRAQSPRLAIQRKFFVSQSRLRCQGHLRFRKLPHSLSTAWPDKKYSAQRNSKTQYRSAQKYLLCDARRIERKSNIAAQKWWVWEELNFRPHPYQGCALTN